MKRKVISLITGILSFVDALALLGVTLVCIFKINSVARVITDTTDDLWGIEMITYAGMGYILAILGIIISAGLAGYRGMLVYYYIKIFSSDEDFYAERRSGIIGFSLLGGILFAVGAVVLIERFSFIPSRMYPFITAFTILYGFLVFLPIIELILSGIIGKRVKKNTENQIPTKESVIEELDELADLQVEEKTEDVKREDKKDEEK
ncbi:MAG: hypothetical protein IJ800_04795, partial [Clostridia bacterium]|nr:hypothetical protein [Clostridia bacterium]